MRRIFSFALVSVVSIVSLSLLATGCKKKSSCDPEYDECDSDNEGDFEAHGLVAIAPAASATLRRVMVKDVPGNAAGAWSIARLDKSGVATLVAQQLATNDATDVAPGRYRVTIEWTGADGVTNEKQVEIAVD